MGWECRGGVDGEIVEPHRLRVGNEVSDQASPPRKFPDAGACLVVDALEHELAQLAVRAEDPECTVAGVDQLDGGMDDRAQRVVEIESRDHREHGVEQAVDVVSCVHDLLEAILHFGQELAESKLGDAAEERRAIVLVWLPGHRSAYDSARGGGIFAARTAAWVRRSTPSLASSRDT